MYAPRSQLGLLLGRAAGFVTVALLNVGNYQYGMADQVFYCPVVLQGLKSGLFPYDAPLLAAQNQLFVFDDWCGALLGGTDVSLPVAFLASSPAVIRWLPAAHCVGRSN